MTPTWYGIYSEEAARRSGTFIYLSLEGEEVEITAVWIKPDSPGYEYEDKVCIGQVERFIRRGRDPDLALRRELLASRSF